MLRDLLTVSLGQVAPFMLEHGKHVKLKLKYPINYTSALTKGFRKRLIFITY